MKEIPNRFENYVHGAAKVCVQNVLGTLRVLYSTMDLHQVATYYDDERVWSFLQKSRSEPSGWKRGEVAK